ncbi:TPA: CPBP family glutamic-type intramembrane protease, partial [Escherichia coli]
LHLQYTDFRTFLMLFLISLVLISAKIKSNGLLMPILLHMAMNAVITGIQYTLLDWTPESPDNQYHLNK